MSILDKPGIIVLENEPKDPNGKYPYKAILERNHEYKGFDGAWILKIVGIYPNGPSLTPGQWYLDTLLGYDGYGSGRKSDFIYIDHGAHWGVGNMLEVLKEAEETVYGKLDEEFVDKYAHIPMNLRNWYQMPNAQAGYEEPKKMKASRSKKPSKKAIEKMQNLEDEIHDLKYSLRGLQSDNRNRRNESEEYSSEIIQRYGEEILDLLNSGASDEEKIQMMKEWNIQQDEKSKEIRNPESLIQEHDYYYGDKMDKEEEELQKQIDQKEEELQKLQSIYESLNEGIACDQGPETD